MVHGVKTIVGKVVRFAIITDIHVLRSVRIEYNTLLIITVRPLDQTTFNTANRIFEARKSITTIVCG